MRWFSFQSLLRQRAQPKNRCLPLTLNMCTRSMRIIYEQASWHTDSDPIDQTRKWVCRGGRAAVWGL